MFVTLEIINTIVTNVSQMFEEDEKNKEAMKEFQGEIVSDEEEDDQI